MWLPWGIRRRQRSVSKARQAKPPKAVEKETAAFGHRKMQWKWFLALLWIPSIAVFYWLFWLSVKADLATFSKDAQRSLFAADIILLGFAQESRVTLAQLRDSKSLQKLRATHYWLILEHCTFWAWLATGVSAWIGFALVVHGQEQLALFGLQVSASLSGALYQVIKGMVARQVFESM